MSRILLADDSPHAQRMGQRILSDEGFEVVTVSDGDSALVRLEDVDPDLVLAHVALPKRSGYELCQYIKLAPRHRHARVILTSGALDPFDETEARRVRADGSLKKPFEASALLETVRSLVEQARRDRGVEELPLRAGTMSPPRGSVPIVALIDAEQVRAAVTVALDAAMPALVDEITEKVLVALSSKPRASRAR